jgi:hypothetical protein
MQSYIAPKVRRIFSYSVKIFKIESIDTYLPFFLPFFGGQNQCLAPWADFNGGTCPPCRPGSAATGLPSWNFVKFCFLAGEYLANYMSAIFGRCSSWFLVSCYLFNVFKTPINGCSEVKHRALVYLKRNFVLN